MTREQLESTKAEHESQLTASRGKLAEAQAAVTNLSQLVLRIEGAVIAVTALLEAASESD